MPLHCSGNYVFLKTVSLRCTFLERLYHIYVCDIRLDRKLCERGFQFKRNIEHIFDGQAELTLSYHAIYFGIAGSALSGKCCGNSVRKFNKFEFRSR